MEANKTVNDLCEQHQLNYKQLAEKCGLDEQRVRSEHAEAALREHREEFDRLRSVLDRQTERAEQAETALAESRGIRVTESKAAGEMDVPNLVSVEIEAGSGARAVRRSSQRCRS